MSLFEAVFTNNEKMVRKLISRRVNINEIAEIDGVTPLAFAVGRGHPNIVRILLSAGADPSIKDSGD